MLLLLFPASIHDSFHDSHDNIHVRNAAGNPLVEILSEMLRSALAWELDHGTPPKVVRSDMARLTGTPIPLYSAPSDSQFPAINFSAGGQVDGELEQSSQQERPPADYL